MKVCIMIEGQHNGELYESSHAIEESDIQEYLKEFLDSYKENPKTAKFNLFYCDCCCGDGN